MPDREELELLKLKAETEKVQAERDRATEEARQAKGLFAQLGKVFTPVVAALTIVFGYLAATHSQRVAEADLKVAKADLEQKQLQGSAAAAQRNLAEAQDKLKDTNAKIFAANTAREKAEAAEKSTQTRLSGLQREYETLQSQQIQQITLGNLSKLIDILDSEPSERQTADSRYVEDIRKEVAGDNQYRDARLAYLTNQAQETNYRPALRGLLYFALFKVTGSNEWLDQIRRLASRELISSWPTFSSLVKLEAFDAKNRADVMCTGYDRYMQEVHDEKEAEDVRHQLIRWDRSVLVQCRRPYVDHLLFVRLQPQVLDFAKWMYASPVGPLPLRNDEPLQGALIQFLKEHRDIKLEFGYPANDKFLRRFGVPQDFIEATLAGSGRQWLEKNKKLVDVWTSVLGKSALERVSDVTIKKVLDNVWITDAELP